MELDQKRRDILATPGHLLIQGGPGCGKTTIALLKARDRARSLEPEQRILFLSFSRAAVRQISQRMGGLIGRAGQERIEIRTFHSFFLDLVRSHAHLLSGRSATIITPNQEPALRAQFEGDWAAEARRMAAEEGRFVFDRLAATAADLLERCPHVLDLYADTYPMIIVDEFQDTNTDQWNAVRALGNHAAHSTLVCLADPDQRIFGYLDGVDEHRIAEAVAVLRPSEFDLSEDNHRSAGGLLAYANAVLRATPATPPEEITPVIYRWPDTAEAATHRCIVVLREHLTRELGRTPELAVLARTNNMVAGISESISTPPASSVLGTLAPVEHDLNFDAALAASAAVVVATLLEWPEQPRHEAVLATLRAVADLYRTKADSGVKGAKTRVSTIENALLDLERGRTPKAKLARVLAATYDTLTTTTSDTATGTAGGTAGGTAMMLEGNSVTDWRFARGLLTGCAELVEVAKHVRAVRLLKATDALAWGLGDAWNGRSYLDAAAVVTAVLADEALDGPARTPAPVTLMNMHKSKGKEFDGVIIAEGQYQSRLLTPGASTDETRDERRLLRVALTRARHHVILIRPRDSLDLTRPL